MIVHRARRPPLRTWLLAALALAGAACVIGDLAVEGRRCSASDPCGAGTQCDLAKSVCVKTASVDGPRDLPPPTENRPDAPIDGPRGELPRDVHLVDASKIDARKIDAKAGDGKPRDAKPTDKPMLDKAPDKKVAPDLGGCATACGPAQICCGKVCAGADACTCDVSSGEPCGGTLSVCCDKGGGKGPMCQPTPDSCQCSPATGNPCFGTFPKCCDKGKGNLCYVACP